MLPQEHKEMNSAEARKALYSFWKKVESQGGIPARREVADNSSPFLLPLIRPPERCLENIRKKLQYNGLPTATSIRVLKVCGLSRRAMDRNPEYEMVKPLQCSMVVMDIADRPDYFALSYTWGDPLTVYSDKKDVSPPEHWGAPAFEIDCDGTPVSVNTNLFTALLAFRFRFSLTNFDDLGPPYNGSPDRRAAYIWVDAICINQDDIAERTAQVSIMDRVYSQARASFLWLGGADDFSTLGLSAMEKLGKLPSIYFGDGRKEEYMKSLNLADNNTYTKLGIERITFNEWFGLQALLSRSWFKRSWIVQEWALSDACVFCKWPLELFFISLLVYLVNICLSQRHKQNKGYFLSSRDSTQSS